eukprot:g3446.t1
MQAYVFHDHERRDTRPYIRANVETFAHPAAKPNVLKKDNRPLTWKASLVPIPDNKTLLSTVSTQASTLSDKSFRKTWLTGVQKELRAVPPEPAGQDAGTKGGKPFGWKDMQSPTKK